MDFQTVLTAAAVNGSGAVQAAMTEEQKAINSARSAALKAYESYFADVEERKQIIQKRVEDLQTELAERESRIKQLQPGIMQATLSGDKIELAKLQSELADLVADREAIKLQISTLRGSPIPGNSDLYQSALQLFAAHDSMKAEYKRSETLIYSTAREQVRAWGEIMDHTDFAQYGNIDKQKAKLEAHFSGELTDPVE